MGARIPKGTREQPRYLSYLLRLYRIDDKENSAWRMSLESTLAGGQVGFASLEDLVKFLRQQMGMMPDADRDDQ